MTDRLPSHALSAGHLATGDRPFARAAVVLVRLWLLVPVVALGYLLYGSFAPGTAGFGLVDLFTMVVFAVPIWLVVAGLLVLLVGMARRHGR